MTQEELNSLDCEPGLEDNVHCAKVEVTPLCDPVMLPNVYVKAQRYDESFNEEDILNYVKKKFGMKDLRQMVCDAIMCGQIEVRLSVSDTDCYSVDTVPPEEMITFDELLGHRDEKTRRDKKKS